MLGTRRQQFHGLMAPQVHSERAMLLMIVGMLFLPSMDAMAKYLTATISAGQVVWFRFVVQTVLLLPFALRMGGPLTLRDTPIHIARGSLMVVGTLVFFTALKYLPIADAIAIFFVEPLILTLFAAWFLGEHVGWRRYVAVLVGLGGAIIVIRPNFQAFGWPALLPLLAATTFAVYLTLTRRLAQSAHPIHMQFFSGASGVVVSTVLISIGAVFDVPVLDLTRPNAFEIALLLGIGFVSTFGHLLVVYAFQLAPAALLAPFQYTEIIGATLLGFIFFADFPDAVTWLGITIIVGSGLYVFHREKYQTSA